MIYKSKNTCALGLGGMQDPSLAVQVAKTLITQQCAHPASAAAVVGSKLGRWLDHQRTVQEEGAVVVCSLEAPDKSALRNSYHQGHPGFTHAAELLASGDLCAVQHCC